MQAIILRGIPGSGKSTLQKKRWPDAWVCSADRFFEKSGEYKFNPALLGKAHGECLLDFVKACTAYGFPTVVVDNTNTTVAEMAPYVAIAEAYGIDVKIYTVVFPVQAAAKRNIHNVPEEVIQKMNERLNKNTLEMPTRWHHELLLPAAATI